MITSPPQDHLSPDEGKKHFSITDPVNPSTPIAQLLIGVVVRKRSIHHNVWATYSWEVVSVIEGAPELPPWSVIENEQDAEIYYAGHTPLRLYPYETDTLKDNLESSNPSVYVFLREDQEGEFPALIGATVCTGEAQAHAGIEGDRVEAVAMSPLISAWVHRFVSRYHVEQPVYKRQRTQNRHNR
ncbi:DUF3305 domain-containing protein [Entomobacter blattae]|uniref:DUF3305 domain-containing protein n=1 Tax=Entomobacter blattae TaxID=2762277 RepID=UPI00193BCCCE|nr:DUF3305 domain-containing protein [Entomobacter blattae]